MMRDLACATFAVVFAFAPDANAAKDHCRKIVLQGNAGNNPKPAIFYVKTNPGDTTLSQSCPVTAVMNEPDINYIKRLPYAWGTSPAACPPELQPGELPYDPLDPLKFRCINYAGGSCRIKSKVAPKTTGTSKKYTEICCYEEEDCGVKLGTSSATPIPITIQVEKLGSGVLCPDPNNCDDCDTCVVDPDPIGAQQLPSPAAARCRAGLAASVSSSIIGISDLLAECHRDRMGGKLPVVTDCNSVTATPKITAAVDAFENEIGSAALACQANRSPAALGIHTCPAPCNGISLGGCTAGNGSPVCETDRDCDSGGGTADGRCGSWTQATQCMSCIIENVVTSAVQDQYGTPPDMLTLTAQKCLNTVGNLFVKLAAARIGATLNCQKRLDIGKGTIAQQCSDQDPGALLADAEAKVAAALSASCSGTDIATLGICGSATTAAQVGACIIANARLLNKTFSHVVVPSTAKVCGDNSKGGFEQCDGTDDSNCPGLCTPQCTCP